MLGSKREAMIFCDPDLCEFQDIYKQNMSFILEYFFLAFFANFFLFNWCLIKQGEGLYMYVTYTCT